MSGPGIIGATVSIKDDVDAINRGRRAECHQLRVLHNIRMSGQAVLSSFNAVATTNPIGGTSHSHYARATAVPVASNSPYDDVATGATVTELYNPQSFGNEGPTGPYMQQGRAFDGNPSYTGSSSDIPGNNATANNSRFDYQNASGVSGAQSRGGYNNSRSTAHTAASRSSVETSQCTGLWCMIRDALLAFAVIGVIYLLLTRVFGSSNSASTTGDAYDFIP